MLGRTTKVMTISLPPETASLVDRLANAEKKCLHLCSSSWPQA